MHKNKKKKFAITTLSALLAFNVGCSSKQLPNITEAPKPVVQQEKVEEYKPPLREFNKFKGKKSVTLGEKKIIEVKEEEKLGCEFINKVKILRKEIALLNLKKFNKEKITMNEICNLRNILTETLLSEQELTNTYTNQSTFFDLNKKTKEVENIENYFYNLKQDYDLEREINCFNNGNVIPTMIKLHFYAENTRKDNLTIEDLCNINDYILFLNEIMEGVTSEKQKTHIEKTIEKLKKLLPEEFKKDDPLMREHNCNILSPSR